MDNKQFLNKQCLALAIVSVGLGVSSLSGAIEQQAWAYTYNAQGLIETVDGPRTDVDDTTHYVYDSRGNLSTVTNALGQTTQWLNYTGRGQPQRLIDHNGVETLLTYHLRGWLETSTIKDPGGDTAKDRITRYGYDDVGQLTSLTQPDGSVMSFEYDEAQRLTAIVNTLGERIEYSLDAAGNRTGETVKSTSGDIKRSQTRVFDELSRLLEIRGNNGQSQSFSYDTNNNNTRQLDAKGSSTVQEFDALNRLSSQLDANGGETQYQRDSQDRITQVIDPRGATTGYQYDAYGNLEQLNSPVTGAANMLYDDTGNLTQKTDARGLVTQHSYDTLNRLIATIYPANTLENASFSYDDTAAGNYGVGRLTGYSNDAGTTDLHYDAHGQLVAEQQQLGSKSFTTGYSYDLAGRVSSITYPSGRTVAYQRDSLGRVTEISSQDTAESSSVTLVSAIEYQAFGGFHSLTYGNGIVQSYTYDLDGRIKQVEATGLGSVRSDYYSYDANNNITGIADQLDSTKDRVFFYDKLDRLSDERNSDGSELYDYDATGNRSARTTEKPGVGQSTSLFEYQLNPNRLTANDGTSWQTDVDGNTQSLGIFSYNHANRLASYSANSQLQATYRYNALGQRVSVEGQENVFLHYDQSGQYLAETLLSSADGPLAQQTDYVYLDGMPIAQIKTLYKDNGDVDTRHLLYLHTDHLNTPRLATDMTQQVTWRWDSDAFGSLQPNTDPDVDGSHDYVNLRFPGQYFDKETGYHYNYFRDYDPSLGRYVQSDPIGLNGGLNTYGYVGGNPVGYIDPYGLDSVYGLNGRYGQSNMVARLAEIPIADDVSLVSGHVSNGLTVAAPLSGPAAPFVAAGATFFGLLGGLADGVRKNEDGAVRAACSIGTSMVAGTVLSKLKPFMELSDTAILGGQTVLQTPYILMSTVDSIVPNADK